MDKTLNAAEARLLSVAEQETVNFTLHPAVAGLSRRDLQALARRLREARDRASTIASQQRREMRGKSEPRGVAPARDDAGTIAKEQVLADALKRVMEQLGQVAGIPDTPAGAVTPATPPIVLTTTTSAAPKPAGGPPNVKRNKKTSVPRSISRETAAKLSKLPTVRLDPREIGRVTKSVMLAQARRDSKIR